MTGVEREDGQAKGQNDALGKNFRIWIILTNILMKCPLILKYCTMCTYTDNFFYIYREMKTSSPSGKIPTINQKSP